MIVETAPRYDINVYMSAEDGVITFARTRNLSATGVFLETDARPAVGSRVRMRFVWGDDAFECTVHIVRHAEDGIGVQFVNLDSLVRRTLIEMMGESKRVRPPDP